MIKDAILDKKRMHRYMLERQWGDNDENFINFVLLNPSTADEKIDDRTITRCINFADSWGYDGMWVTNLFAYRATNPIELQQPNIDPIGKLNDKYIEKYAKKSKIVVIAWGNHGNFLNRDKEVLKILSKIKTPHCLAITKSESPKHPLYINRNTKPFKY